LAPDTDALDDDGAGAITEFLVAPLQPKGAESGSAKSLVDKACRERESQETRRLLYVAATRARDELHLFARPEFKTAEDQSLSLVPSTGSLLATAWPGLHKEVQRTFEAWCAERSAQIRSAQSEESQTIDSLAASAEYVLAMPAPHDASATVPATLRRLPPSFRSTSDEFLSATEEQLAGEGGLYERHEGGLIHARLATPFTNCFNISRNFS